MRWLLIRICCVVVGRVTRGLAATGVGTCRLTTLDVGVVVCALLTAATDCTGFGVV